MTLLISILAVLTAIGFPHVISAFAFVGGTGVIILVVAFPVLIRVKLSKKKWYRSWENLLAVSALVVFCSVGLAAAGISLAHVIGYVDLH